MEREREGKWEEESDGGREGERGREREGRQREREGEKDRWIEREVGGERARVEGERGR